MLGQFTLSPTSTTPLDRLTIADVQRYQQSFNFGIGTYELSYTMLRANTDAGFELGGPQGIFTYTATPGQTGFPACLTCTPVAFDASAAAATVPPRNITIRPGMAVIVDTEVARLGLFQPVSEQSEVHFLPAIGGG